MSQAPAPLLDPPTQSWSKKLALVLASGLGFGYAPVASGTFGALWGLPLAWGIQQLDPLWLQVLAIVAVCLVGIPLSTAAAQQLGAKDPGVVVFDEIASMPMTFFLVPMTGIWVIVVGFVFNRIFDILKPPPAKRLEYLPDGLGIMADDWVAGIYSNILLHAVVWTGLLGN